MKDILITICGRGGSKGVQGKNLRCLAGAPLIFWALYDAINVFKDDSGLAVSVAVDSDSDAILEKAREYLPSACFHRRKDALAGDFVPKLAVIQNVLWDCQRKYGKSFDIVIDLDITSPLRTLQDIRNVYDKSVLSNLDVVYSVVPARRNPYFNMVEKRTDGSIVKCKRSDFVSRQQCPSVYEMNASIYAYRADSISDRILSFNDLSVGISVMKDYGVLDIDSEEDLEFMDLIARHLIVSEEDSYFRDKHKALLNFLNINSMS